MQESSETDQNKIKSATDKLTNKLSAEIGKKFKSRGESVFDVK